MVNELNNGQTVSLDTIRSGGLTVKGKPLNLEQDENDPNLYTAKIEYTDEEKEETGAKDLFVTYSLNEPVGTVVIVDALPESDAFKDLTDAEKFTKMNSLEFQTGKPEPTQLADGSLRGKIGIEASQNKEAKKAKRESYKKNSLNKEINSDEAVEKKRQELTKLNKERSAVNFEAEEEQNKLLSEQANTKNNQ